MVFMSTDNQVLAKVEEIINYIKSSKDYQDYLKLKDIMSKDDEIRDNIQSIKKLQKILVNTPSKKEEIEEVLDNYQNKLHNNPLYREYLNKVDDINNVFNIIENEINNYFYNKVN